MFISDFIIGAEWESCGEPEWDMNNPVPIEAPVALDLIRRHRDQGGKIFLIPEWATINMLDLFNEKPEGIIKEVEEGEELPTLSSDDTVEDGVLGILLADLKPCYKHGPWRVWEMGKAISLRSY